MFSTSRYLLILVTITIAIGNCYGKEQQQQHQTLRSRNLKVVSTAGAGGDDDQGSGAGSTNLYNNLVEYLERLFKDCTHHGDDVFVCRSSTLGNAILTSNNAVPETLVVCKYTEFPQMECIEENFADRNVNYENMILKITGYKGCSDRKGC